MKLEKRNMVKQRQTMKRRLVIAGASSILLLVVILFFVFNIGNVRHGFAGTEKNPVLAVRWVTISNDGVILQLKLQIQSANTGHRMNSGDFYFAYDPKGMNFSSFKWAAAFDPTTSNTQYYGSKIIDYGNGTGFDRPDLNEMVISLIANNTNTGVVFNNTGWLDLATLVFNVGGYNKPPNVVWTLELNGNSNLNMFDAFTDHVINYDIGTGWMDPINITPYVKPTVVKTPVVLAAEVIGNAAHLSWKTTDDASNSKFSIERSADGIHFSQLQELLGTSSDDYATIDESPLEGQSFYRLMETDNAGKLDTLSTASISYVKPGEFAIVAINPTSFSESTNLVYKMPETGSPRLVITNLNGKTVVDEALDAQRGENTYRIHTSPAWQPGMYIATLIFNGKSVSSKMIKN